MKFCPNCGQKLVEDAEFCPNCGTPVQNNKTNKSDTDVPNNNSIKKPEKTEDGHLNNSKEQVTQDNLSSSTNEQATENNYSNNAKEQAADTFQNIKEVVQKNGYFNYFKNTIKNPSSALSSKNTYYGWIHIAVLSLVFTLSFYFLMRGLVDMTISMQGMGFDYGVRDNIVKILGKALIPRLFIISFITYLIYPLTAFITLKFFSESEYSFNYLLNRISGLFTPSMLILVLSILISILFKTPNLLGFAAVLIIFTLPLINTAYNYYIFHNVKSDKIDKFYIILLSNLLLSFLSFLVAFVQMDAFISIMQQIEYYLY